MLKHTRPLFLKKYLIVLIVIVIYSFVYTFMISMLFAETYNEITYYLDSGISASIIGCTTVFIVYKLDNLIDKNVKVVSKSILLFKFILSLLSSVTLFFILALVLNLIIRDSFNFSFSFFKEQIIIINYLVIIILSYHTIVFFIRKVSEKNKNLEANNIAMNAALNNYIKRIPSVVNKKTSLIPIEEIMYFKIEDGVVFAFLANDKKQVLTETTLLNLESKINPNIFFRINRSEIVNINKIDSYEPYFKDRLTIKLTDKKSVLYTSNSRSVAFKNWLLNPTNSSLI